MYSKIEKDILIKFDDRDLVNGEYTIPNNVSIIAEDAFGSSKINNCIIPNSVKVIEKCAFGACYNLKKIKIPESVERIGQCPFAATDLEFLILPTGLTHIDTDLFWGCSKSISVTIGNKKVNLSRELKERFASSYPFLIYAIKNNKFIPNNSSIILNTNPNEIENYYVYSKRWQTILNKYNKEWRNWDELDTVGDFVLHNTKINLYKICTILGVLQNHSEKDWQKLNEFIEKQILTLSPDLLHRMFGGFDVRGNGYNEEFAKFFIKNYTPPRCNEYDTTICFMERIEDESYYEYDEHLRETMRIRPILVRYLARAYNNWNKVKYAYPNRTTLNNREYASENNSLTVDDVINVIKNTKYYNVDEDNEEMVRVVGVYGYTQEEFDELQEIWNSGKLIKSEQMVLRVEEDGFEGKGVKYELLSKDNPEGLILGEKTNCCQIINDAGKSCMVYGITKPNSGFIKFTFDDQIVGQSWVWYNEQSKVVCLDNIEIPTIWLNKFKKSKNLTKSFQQCLIRLANAFINKMEKNGCKVDKVTVGAGYNDFEGLERFEKVNEILNRFTLPNDYNGYSDAKGMQYIISGVKFEDLYEEGVTL